ncbi:hypothetical protein Cgig2_016824 [Carnegiea gigantea]|uniref:Uncharacterized protein n=1 Tax=Carnegiea gigantea TaxID=171969 RepID=A0A9Q1QF61_9CARY|nr:hypothetical protein Cgig2_016824 [Carnegiea gigantea]
MIHLYLVYDAWGTKTYEDIGTKYKCSKSSCTARTSTSVASITVKVYMTRCRFLAVQMVFILVVNMNGAPITFPRVYSGSAKYRQKDNHHHQSCLMVQCLAYVDQEHYILSDICKTPVDAMQNVARKTLNYLQASYQFTMYNVNYEAMQTAWAECCRRCKKCELLHSKIATQEKGKAIVKYSG